MFSNKLTHSYFLGMSGTIWLTANLFVILSSAALVKAIADRQPAYLFASLLAALLGVLSYSTAIYSLAVLLVCCVCLLLLPRTRGPISVTVVIGIAVTAVLVLTLLLHYRGRPSHHPAWQYNPVELGHFVLIYLGSALADRMRALFGLALLVAGLTSIFWLKAQGQAKNVLLWTILFFYAPFNALMTGIGRLGFGGEVAASSRYQSVTAISLIATIVLVLAALPKGVTSRHLAVVRGTLIIALMVMAVALATHSTPPRNVLQNEAKLIAEVALRQGLEGKQHLPRGLTEPMLPMLRAAHHAPFHWQTNCEKHLYRRVADPNGRSAGAIETMQVFDKANGEGRAIELSGFAERDGVTAECIAIVDGSAIVIGSGVSVSRRQDIENRKGHWRVRIGWKAVAEMPRVMPVCALALFDNAAKWVQLSNCQTSLGGSNPTGR